MRNVISKALEGRYFNVAVDLGCGEGRYGEIFKKHVKYLIGIDHNVPRLSVAKKFAGYDKVVWSEIQDYEIPPGTEAIFMLELIEHLTEHEGVALLNRISHVSFVLLTTPSTFHPAGLRNHHVSLWSEQKLQAFGFRTTTFNYGFPAFIYGPGILAIRYSGGIL